MNLAATSMATHSYGDAVRTVKYTFNLETNIIRVRFREQVGHLTEANKLLPNDEKLLLRRARANTCRDFVSVISAKF